MVERTLRLENRFQAATRDGFGRGLLELGEKNERVVTLAADLGEPTRVLEFAKTYPKRYVEVGVAEQNMVGVAVGLAASGFVPFAASFAAFVPGRSFDQIRVQVAYGEANVKLVASHAGLTVGPDGATHQMLEDIAMMRALPNLTVVVPADAEEARKATLAAAAWPGPVYLRLGRSEVARFTTRATPFAIGRAQQFKTGRDVTVLATGIMTYPALMAAEKLRAEKIFAQVIHVPTVKPLDEETILEAIRRTKRVVVCEEAQAFGGLGGAVAELLASRHPAKMVQVAVADQFGQSGSGEELLEQYGLSEAAIQQAVKRMVKG